MATNPEDIKKLKDGLEEIEEINARIAEQNKKAAVVGAEERKRLEKRIEREKERRAILEGITDEIQKQLDLEEEQAEAQTESTNQAKKERQERDAIGRSWAKLGKETQKQLKQSTNGSNAYFSLNQQLVNLKKEQSVLDGEDYDINQEKQDIIKAQLDSLVSQAKQTVTSERSAKGLSDRARERVELEESLAGFNDDEKESILASFDATTKLSQKEQRLTAIKKAQSGIYEALPESIQGGIGFMKQLTTATEMFGVEAAVATGGLILLAGIIVAALQSFTALQSAGEDFRKETGITNSQMGEMQTKVNNITKSYAQFGVEAKDVYDTISALKSEFADFVDYSQSAVAALTVMKSNFGVSAESAAKVQGILEEVSGLSEDTAASVQLQVANMSKLAGVAPKKVIDDIAKSAEYTSTLFKGDINLIAKQAVEARRLGSNLESVSKTAEKLLDFESGIGDELKASTFVGGKFNLSVARGLAYAGKTVEANQEILNQIQRSGDFRKQDYFTQQALAKAAGKSVEEINKELTVRDKLSKLSGDQLKQAQDAVNKGLDISKINDDQLGQQVAQYAAQQETASQITQIENTLKGIVATVGGSLVPLFNALSPVLKVAFFPLKLAAFAIQFIVDGITWLLKKIPGLGALMEGVGNLFSKADSFLSNTTVDSLSASTPGSTTDDSGVVKTGDLLVPESGGPVVASKGKIFQGALSDEVAMAPGIAGAVNANTSTTTSTQNGNSSTIFNSLLNEIQGMRNDLKSGKIAVYMDAQRVTNNIGRQADKSTRNNYSFA